MVCSDISGFTYNIMNSGLLLLLFNFILAFIPIMLDWDPLNFIEILFLSIAYIFFIYEYKYLFMNDNGFLGCMGTHIFFLIKKKKGLVSQWRLGVANSELRVQIP